MGEHLVADCLAIIQLKTTLQMPAQVTSWIRLLSLSTGQSPLFVHNVDTYVDALDADCE